MVKMIVVDLDGTILTDNEKVSTATKKYLMKLKEKGYIITIATGRIYASAVNATDGANFANYIITDTGSCIYDNRDDKPIYVNSISKNTAIKLFNYYDENCRYIYFCDKNTIYKYSDETPNSDSKLVKTTKDKDYIINSCKNISHASISMKNNDAVIKLYNKMVKEMPELNMMLMQDSFSDKKWIEIIPNGCSKYNSIKLLAKHLNISNDEIIAFGDGLNDIDMLEKCGYGVALSNALIGVKEKAKDITKFDNNNDGVINYLKDYLYD